MIWLRLPALLGLSTPEEFAFLTGINERIAAWWFAWTPALRTCALPAQSGLHELISYQAAFLLLPLSPVLGIVTLAALLYALPKRPLIEKILAIGATLLSLAIAANACLILWHALLKAHYIS